MDDLKTLVKHLNEIFQSDYNLSTFDALTSFDLLQLTLKLLTKMGIPPQDTKLPPSLQLLKILELIKYIPSTPINPEAFRDALAEGSKKILHPILLFLFKNQTKVKKLHYLSSYVTKIDVPKEFLYNDRKMQELHGSHLLAIDRFWEVYSENRKEAAFAKEANELEEDIYQMKHDLSNLEKRLEVQSSKTDFPESFLILIRSLIKETKQRDILNKQLATDKKNLDKMTDTIRGFNRRDKIMKLEDLLEKSEYYTSARQVYQNTVNELGIELEIIETVANGLEPFPDEIKSLEEEVCRLQRDVQFLNRSKQRDDSLEAFGNQQKILIKKKQQLFKQIVKLRLNNEQIVSKIEEVCGILGGDILRGKNFKEYVAELKALSNDYKKRKFGLKAIEQEEEILLKTLSSIYKLEPNLKSNIKESVDVVPEEIRDLSLPEIRTKTLKLKRSYEVNISTCIDEEKKYQKIKDVFSDHLIQFDQTKRDFNEKTEFLPESVDSLEKELKKLENLLNLEQEDLQVQEEGSEKLQDNLFRYSQMYIDNAGDLSTPEVLGLKLQEAQQTLDTLRIQMNAKQQELYAQEDEKTTMKNIILMIKEGKTNL